MNEDVATKKNILSLEDKQSIIRNTVETSRFELESKNTLSDDMARFQRQHADNQKVKVAMAKELAQMELGLPDHVVDEILNIDDEVPF